MSKIISDFQKNKGKRVDEAFNDVNSRSLILKICDILDTSET